MKRILRHRPSPGTAFGLAALVVAVGGVAFATIPDSSGTIHGCYDRRGALRVIDTEASPPQTCRSRETPLTWNQQGPPGPPGPSTVRALGDVTLADGENKVLLVEGPISLVARCRPIAVQGGTDHVAFVVATTTEDHTAFSGGFSQGREGEIPSDAPNPFGEENGTLMRYGATQVGEFRFTSHDFSVAAPDGTRLSGVLNLGVNALGRPGKCVFGGHVVVG